jgi:hypothetical protein
MSKFKKFDDVIDIKGNINLNNNESIKDNRIENPNNNNDKMVNNDANLNIQSSSGFINNFIISFNFIGKYFNVELEDIQNKFIFSLIPFKKGFNDIVENSPDLYGPFWLYTTLIFIIGVTSNISGYLNVIKNNLDRKENIILIQNQNKIFYFYFN